MNYGREEKEENPVEVPGLGPGQLEGNLNVVWMGQVEAKQTSVGYSLTWSQPFFRASSFPSL